MSITEQQIRDFWAPTSLPRGTSQALLKHLFPQPYQQDPVGWVRDVLGEFPWSKQREILESVRDNRYTAVQSAHQTGKSYIAARAVAWWIDQHPPGRAFVVTTAPTARQVSTILWREMRHAHSKGDLTGRLLGGGQPTWKIGPEEVAIGAKPADKVDPEQAMQAFQGYHADYMLVVIDEACGIPRWLWDAADSLIGNDDSEDSASRILAIGNPDNPASHFHEVCRPGSGWKRIQISALDTPVFTGEPVPEEVLNALVGRTWVRERLRRWGKRSPTFISKVLGLFPKVALDTLISPALIEAAQIRDLSRLKRRNAGRYGVDVADFGADETVIYHNDRGVVRLATMPTGEHAVWHGQDTMATAGQVKRLLKSDYGETTAVVDGIGVGSGVVARLQEMGLPAYSFKSSERAYRSDRFINRRSEQWWIVRELFEAGLIDIDEEDDDLASQIGAIKWRVIDSSGRIQVEPKDEMKRRLGGSSPDRADAFMMSCVPWDHLRDYDRRRTDWKEELTPDDPAEDLSDVVEADW